MYTLRYLLKSPDHAEDAFRRVRDMGAQCVQALYSPGVTAEFLGGMSKKYALPICLVHAPFERVQNGLDRLAEEFLTFGCGTVGIGMMPSPYRQQGPQGAAAFTDLLNETGLKLQKHGLKISYHNHAFEFKAEGGQTVFDYLVENTEPYVRFTPDVYWIKVGGYEPEKVLEKLVGRTDVIHLKDYQKLGLPLMRAIGAGTLDFPAILRQAEKSGAADAVVELDYAVRPYRSLEKSLRYLKV